MRPVPGAQFGRGARGQERTKSAPQPVAPWTHRPLAANDPLPTVFPPHVTDSRGGLVSGLSVTAGIHCWNPLLESTAGIRKEMVMRVVVAGGAGGIGARRVPRALARGHPRT